MRTLGLSTANFQPNCFEAVFKTFFKIRSCSFYELLRTFIEIVLRYLWIEAPFGLRAKDDINIANEWLTLFMNLPSSNCSAKKGPCFFSPTVWKKTHLSQLILLLLLPRIHSRHLTKSYSGLSNRACTKLFKHFVNRWCLLDRLRNFRSLSFSLFCTNFRFRRVSRPTAETSSPRYFLRVQNLLLRDLKLLQRKTSVCNTENWPRLWNL